MFWNNKTMLIIREDLHLVFFPEMGSLDQPNLENATMQTIFLKLPGLLGQKISEWQLENGYYQEYFDL